VSEKLFAADSACALAILETCHGDAGGDAVWRITLRGLDKLLDDLGFSLAGKLAIAGAARDSFGAEFGMDTAMQKRLGDKFRTHRADITDLLGVPDGAVDHTYAPAIAAIAERSRRLAPIAAELHALANAGKLTRSIEDLAHSYLHMAVNRMIRTAPRAHEVVLYDLLRRHYDGLAARQRKAG
jgi:thiopeptide-type bacteriocin biosynthesis protein